MPDRLSIRSQTALFVGLLCTTLVLATTLAIALVEFGNARLLIGRQMHERRIIILAWFEMRRLCARLLHAHETGA